MGTKKTGSFSQTGESIDEKYIAQPKREKGIA
jgi:hypothetical protein